MSIPKGLIIYKPSQYTASFPVCTKYRFGSNKIYYTSNPTDMKRQEKTISSKGSKQIFHVIRTSSIQITQSLRFIRYLSAITTLKRLSLTVVIAHNSKISQKMINDFFCCIFTRAKRINHIDLTIYGNRSCEKILLNQLSLLSSLEKLKVRFVNFVPISSLSSFAQFIKRRGSFPCLHSQAFELNLLKWENVSIQDIDSFFEKLEDFEQLSSKKTKLLLHLILDPSFDPLLSKKLAKLQYLTNLSLKSGSSLGTDIITSLNGVTNLENIMIKLSNDQVLNSIDLLPKTLSKMELLQSLKLEIVNCTQTQTMIEFMSQLDLTTQLISLDLFFNNIKEIDDNLFIVLGKSLSKLQNLHYLSLSIAKSGGDSSKITSFGVGSLFKAFKNLIILKELTLSFPFYGKTINDQVFGVLCESVGNLVNLRTLMLDFGSNTIGNQGIACLQKVMSFLPKLETLCLYFSHNELLPCEVFEEFIRNLCCFPALSRLNLIFSCLKITQELSSAFTLLVNNLKCLDNLLLILFTSQHVPNYELTNLYNKLIKKYYVEIQTHVGV